MDKKSCSKCYLEKPANLFGKSTYTSDGLQSWCKQCKAALTKQLREADPEKAKASRRKYYKSKPENIWLTKLVTCAAGRAKKYGIPIDKDAVRAFGQNYQQGTSCPCCHIPMTF
jgi:hypothetical protein